MTAVAYLTEGEFAARIRRAKRTVRRWRSEGTGPAFVRIGRQAVYAEDTAKAWEAKRTFCSNADEAARRHTGGADASP